jgi:hypothetical protein
MLNKLLSFLFYLFGPRKTIGQCLEELVRDMDPEEYKKMRNIQGQKLEVESLRLVWSKKE